jgi:hypothetical protein
MVKIKSGNIKSYLRDIQKKLHTAYLHLLNISEMHIYILLFASLAKS